MKKSWKSVQDIAKVCKQKWESPQNSFTANQSGNNFKQFVLEGSKVVLCFLIKTDSFLQPRYSSIWDHG